MITKRGECLQCGLLTVGATRPRNVTDWSPRWHESVISVLNFGVYQRLVSPVMISSHALVLFSVQGSCNLTIGRT
jgi:hypothetical protein